MTAAALVADVTDTPVWFLGAATAVLAAATIALAIFTRRALGQLKTALRELEEVQRDREVSVFSELGRRWLRRAIQRAYGFDHLPADDEVAQVSDRWRPYRSLAVSYLFASEYDEQPSKSEDPTVTP